VLNVWKEQKPKQSQQTQAHLLINKVITVLNGRCSQSNDKH